MGDPLSAFGGIVAFNKKLSLSTAKLLVKNFYEVIAAPDFEKEALHILRTKKNLRVLKVKKFMTINYPIGLEKYLHKRDIPYLQKLLKC